MGYKRPVLKLTFEDPEFEGLEVRARRLSVGEVVDVSELAEMKADTPAEMKKIVGELIVAVGGLLLSWNLEEEATDEAGVTSEVAVPCNADGLRRQDMGFVMAIVDALVEASASVPAPLGRNSSGGDPSLEASIPMEPLSPSPPS